ncbi:hypothetical protein B0T10DRAFT_531035 [Thelonectria olida]|uniref:Monooxygenase n=1 Tax=Thelonectria olida TaxID=1576542 RepID=A0A9P9AMD9_9HYPO|nr:hypothetical protein B0T10DRAFT_531035 [Thelonectria olida]
MNYATYVTPRRLRCTIIGAGVSGLLMAYKLRKHLGDYIDFQIFEKNPDLGGTWHENTYPGCACDVPSHCYQFSFAPNPYWSQFYASSAEIKAYLKAVARHFELEQFITYNCKVVSASWSEKSGTWTTKLENGPAIQSEILVNAGGILNNLQIPNIQGLSTFAGPKLHTAAWDPSIDLTGKKIAIIGSGASGVQLLPQLQPIASKVQVFIRTPSWIAPPVALPAGKTSNYSYLKEEKEAFIVNREDYLDMRKEYESNFNGMFRGFIKGSAEQRDMRATFEKRMKSIIQDETLQKRLIPSFEAGCRRINPGESFLVSLQEPNVEPVFDGIDRITPNGVVAGGKEYPADVLVTATGFNTSFRPRWAIYGRNNVNLQDLWAETPVSYLGTGVSGFPNYLVFLGPNTPISNGSLMGSLEATSDYFIRILRKMVRQGVKAFNVRPDAQADFDEHTQTMMKNMVWTGTCRSWFKKGTEGKVTALWPGSSLHYMQVLAENRWEDYEWVYDKERYAYWGQGLSWIESPELDPLGLEERESSMTSTTLPRKESDLTYYLWKSDPLPPQCFAAPMQTKAQIARGGLKNAREKLPFNYAFDIVTSTRLEEVNTTHSSSSVDALRGVEEITGLRASRAALRDLVSALVLVELGHLGGILVVVRPPDSDRDL